MKYTTDTATPPRILVCGEPASGKTAGIAELANAGFRVLLHDFDCNSRVLGTHLKPGHADVYIQSYAASKLTDTNLFVGSGSSSKDALEELRKFTKMLEHWKTDTEDLGPAKDLTYKDVVVIDSGTFLGELLFLAAKEDKEANKHAPTQYRIAGNYFSAIMDYLTGPKCGASVVMLTHLMKVGEKDDQGNIIADKKIIPVAIGEKMSRRLGSYFSDIWTLEVDRAGNRTIQTGATNVNIRRTSNPSVIKAVEPYDMGALLTKLTAK